MDRWAWEQIGPWLTLRACLPVGALFCVLGPNRGRPGSAAGIRVQLRNPAIRAGVRRRFARHQCGARTPLRCRLGVLLLVIQRQLGHADVGITDDPSHKRAHTHALMRNGRSGPFGGESHLGRGMTMPVQQR
jgi:hypothetical protein